MADGGPSLWRGKDEQFRFDGKVWNGSNVDLEAQKLGASSGVACRPHAGASSRRIYRVQTFRQQSLGDIIPRTPISSFLPFGFFPLRPISLRTVRQVDRKMHVANATLVKVPFDLAHWRKVAAEKYPDGLPEPYSDDPTQWLFHGHPRYAEPGTELHVALARARRLSLAGGNRRRDAPFRRSPRPHRRGRRLARGRRGWAARPGSGARRAPARRPAARLLRRRLG